MGQAFLIRETARRRLVSEASALVLRSERWAKEVDERVLVLLGRPSGRRPDCPSGPLCFRLLGRPMNYMLFSWAKPWRGSRSSRDPGFMNPTGAPEALADSGKIVRGVFVLPAGARERTHGCSPRAPGRFVPNWLGGVFEFVNGGCFYVLSVGVAPEP